MSRRRPPWLDPEFFAPLFGPTPGEQAAELQQELRAARECGPDRRTIARMLEELCELGGLQSWRDYAALAEHRLESRRPGRAREVILEALELLKGQPRMGRARRELQNLLLRAPERKCDPDSPRAWKAAPASSGRSAGAPSKRGRAASERGRQSAPAPAPAQATEAAPTTDDASAERATPAAAQATASAPLAGEAAVPAPPVLAVPDEVPVRMQIKVEQSADLATALQAGTAGDAKLALVRRRAALLAAQVAMADSFDHLLCLDTMRDVEHMQHQIETVRRVVRVLRGRALLADEVGLGKTIEAAMVLSEYLQRGLVHTVLILVPAALVGQWREELSAKFGIDAATTEDADYRADPVGFWSRHPVAIASLELARRRRHQEILVRRTYDLVIVDEAHRLKRSQTMGHRLVDGLRSRFLLLLSATPVENNLEELYNVITLLRPGQLKTRASFKRRFVSARDPARPQHADELRGLLSEVMIRNTRALVDLRLPPRFASTVRCEPTAQEREIYARIGELVASCYGSARERLALATLMQEAGSSPRAVAATAHKLLARPDLDPGLASLLRPIVDVCGELVETAKGRRLLELLHLAREAGERTVVFTRYRQTLALLEELLAGQGLDYCTFSGAMSGPDKDEAVRALESEVPVMLATEVGGEGRNLQCASTLINFDLPWNPMRLEQRIGRLHRIGQRREVRIYNLCAAGSAEDRILEVLDRRINMFELVVGELDMILGQLEDERDLAERVLEIYGTARDSAEIDAGFSRLGDELTAARARHDQVKQLDQLLFGQDFEV